MQRSGNSYKVRLALALLNAPYHAIEIDILRGESRTPDFSPRSSGQVPLLEVAEGRYLAESNAILWYVASGTPLAPEYADRPRRGVAMDVLRAARAGTDIGAAYFWLSLVRGGRDLQDPCARRLDGARLCLAAGDRRSPQVPRIFCRGPAPRSPMSQSTATPMSPTAATTICDLPGDPHLAAAGRAGARLRHHGLRRPDADVADAPGVAAEA